VLAHRRGYVTDFVCNAPRTGTKFIDAGKNKINETRATSGVPPVPEITGMMVVSMMVIKSTP
jgi:hypothetical protein